MRTLADVVLHVLTQHERQWRSASDIRRLLVDYGYASYALDAVIPALTEQVRRGQVELDDNQYRLVERGS